MGSLVWSLRFLKNSHRAYCHLIDSHRHRSIHTRVLHLGARGRGERERREGVRATSRPKHGVSDFSKLSFLRPLGSPPGAAKVSRETRGRFQSELQRSTTDGLVCHAAPFGSRADPSPDEQHADAAKRQEHPQLAWIHFLTRVRAPHDMQVTVRVHVALNLPWPVLSSRATPLWFSGSACLPCTTSGSTMELLINCVREMPVFFRARSPQTNARG